ncbi:DUF4832 domain-containing protein [bacterium]|nr:DUF4832 domain-containing protein [bacterium]
MSARRELLRAVRGVCGRAAGRLAATRARARLEPCDLRELGATTDAGGRGRGWYEIVTVDLEPLVVGALEAGWPERAPLPALPIQAVPAGVPLDCAVVLLLVRLPGRRDLSPFGERASDVQTALIDRLLGAWEAAGKDMVVRAAYDVRGRGMTSEPDALGRVLRDARAVGVALGAHAGATLCCQGLLVGSWGEMHDSRYLGGRQLGAIYDALRSGMDTGAAGGAGVAGGGIPVAVRTPRLLELVREGSDRARADGLLGLFDDAMMGSASDMGTFDAADRAAGVARLRDAASRVPFGGEAVGTTPQSMPEAALAYLRAARPTYLNRVHDAATLARWAAAPSPAAPGGGAGEGSLLDYVGAHLGYRLVVTGVRLEGGDVRHDAASPAADAAGRGGVTLEVRVQNRGFSPLYVPARVVVDVWCPGDAAARASVAGALVWRDDDRTSGIAHLLLSASALPTAPASHAPAPAGRGVPGDAAAAWLVARCVRETDGAPVPFANAPDAAVARDVAPGAGACVIGRLRATG